MRVAGDWCLGVFGRSRESVLGKATVLRARWQSRDGVTKSGGVERGNLEVCEFFERANIAPCLSRQALALEVDVAELVKINRPRFPGLTQKARLIKWTPIALPRNCTVLNPSQRRLESVLESVASLVLFIWKSLLFFFVFLLELVEERKTTGRVCRGVQLGGAVGRRAAARARATAQGAARGGPSPSGRGRRGSAVRGAALHARLRHLRAAERHLRRVRRRRRPRRAGHAQRHERFIRWCFESG